MREPTLSLMREVGCQMRNVKIEYFEDGEWKEK